MKKTKIAVGEKFTFVPYWRGSYGMEKASKRNALSVTGTIVYVNHPHRYFRVEFPAGKRGKMLSECFKF